MTIIIDIKQYRHKKVVSDIAKQYIAYYGNSPKEVLPIKPKLKVVNSTNTTEYTEDDIAQLQGNTDIDNYLKWLSDEGIDISTFNIIKPDPKVPY